MKLSIWWKKVGSFSLLHFFLVLFEWNFYLCQVPKWSHLIHLFSHFHRGGLRCILSGLHVHLPWLWDGHTRTRMDRRPQECWRRLWEKWGKCAVNYLCLGPWTEMKIHFYVHDIVEWYCQMREHFIRFIDGKFPILFRCSRESAWNLLRLSPYFIGREHESVQDEKFTIVPWRRKSSRERRRGEGVQMKMEIFLQC